MIALALVLLPLVGSAGLLLLRSRPRAIAVAAVAVLLITLVFGGWAAFTEPTFSWHWSPRIELRLAVEDFGRVMVVLVPLIAAPIVAYAAATEGEGRLRLLVLMLAFVGAMLLLVSAADFLTLLFAWELVGFVSWALIGHRWRDPSAGRSAAQAFLTTRTGDIGLYVAAGMTFVATGGFAFAGLPRADSVALGVVAAGVLVAAAAKSAQLPFSPWLFAAMAGPTPVSALLHSATLVAAGAYLLIRLAPALAPVSWFLPAVALVGIATAVAGGVVAVIQTDLKRALAASTSAQYGLMFVAVGAGSAAAGAAHLVAHAAFKSLLFLTAGIAIHAAGSGRFARLGVGSSLPRVAVLSAIGALALAAMPPLGAAWSKEQILAAAVDASPWLGIGVLGASFLTALYAGRYQLLAYGVPTRASTASRAMQHADVDGRGRNSGPGWVVLTSVAVLAALTLLLSALWLPGADRLVESAAQSALGTGRAWERPLAIAILVLAGGLVWWLLRRDLLLRLGLPVAVQARAADWLGLPTAIEALAVRPVVALSRTLAQLDDRVIDAGVRGVAWSARRVSALFARRGEWTFDGAVRALSALTLSTAEGSRATDDRVVDAAVEGGAQAVAAAGQASRRLQTGQAHHYYVMLAAGLIVMLAILVVPR